MGLFVHEYFSSGAYSGELWRSSLAPEGLAMLGAVLQDFAACSASRPVTTLDVRLRAEAARRGFADWADLHWAESPQHEFSLFETLARQGERTFVIAPESDGILLARCRLVERAGGHFLGHADEAIALCSDKLAFCEHLTRHDLPTIATQVFDPSAAAPPFAFPIVVKPRDGAGSQETYLIRDEEQFAMHRPTLAATFGRDGHQAIVQPYVAGETLSVAAIAAGGSRSVEVFPTGRQHLSDNGRFHYQGGTIPAPVINPAGAERLVRDVCRSIPGLAGYIGFDLILAPDGRRLLIVEANPRLTTAYLGYRALATENLAVRMLHPGRAAGPIRWSTDSTAFTPDGQRQRRASC
jgi:tyramine---L-glutamate ligase